MHELNATGFSFKAVVAELLEQTNHFRKRMDSERQERQEGDKELRSLINDSISHQGHMRDELSQDLANLQMVCGQMWRKSGRV